MPPIPKGPGEMYSATPEHSGIRQRAIAPSHAHSTELGKARFSGTPQLFAPILERAVSLWVFAVVHIGIWLRWVKIPSGGQSRSGVR